MKRIVVLGVLLICFSGCSGKEPELEQGLALRAKLLNGDSFSFDADITADYGDKLHIFSMECTSDNTGSLDFTVTAPQSVSGITGNIDAEGGRLTFDDLVLHFELLTDEQLSPVSAPWIFVRTLRSGYIVSASREDGKICMTIQDRYDENALVLDIRLDDQELPERAQILCDGRRILTMDVKNVVIR